jgi:hypothetical protein
MSRTLRAGGPPDERSEVRCWGITVTVGVIRNMRIVGIGRSPDPMHCSAIYSKSAFFERVITGV